MNKLFVACIVGLLCATDAYAQMVNICERTPLVRNEVLSQLGVSSADYDSECSSVSVAALGNISFISLALEEMDSLTPDDFAHLTGLLDLELWGNQLTSLPEGIFAGLINLEFLDLAENQLASLPDNVFDDLVNLIYLDLSVNQLSGLSPKTFTHSNALTDLYLYENQLTELPEGIFAGLHELDTLDLHANELKSLPEGIFSDLTALADIGLWSNQLTNLPEGIFSASTVLNVIDLEQNQLATLPENIFADLMNVMELNLTDNPFDEGLPNLDVLLRDVPATANLGLSLTSIRGELPSSLTIAGINRGVPNDIRDAFARNSGSGISGIRSASDYNVIVGNPNIVTATVTNHILTVTSLTTGRTTVRVVGIHGSASVKYPTTLTVTVGNQINICNRTSPIRDGILDQLGIEPGEYMTACMSVAAADLGSITDLVFSGISALKVGDFDHLNGLITLELQGNGLTGLPENIFVDLHNLTILDISVNQLTNLSETVFESLEEIIAINLSSNELTTLPENIFAGLTKLSAVELSNNPFNEGLPNLDVLFADVPVGIVIALDLAPIRTGLPSELRVIGIGADASVDISGAFAYSPDSGISDVQSASDYKVMVGNSDIVTATVMNHILTVTGHTTGLTTITVVGIHESTSVIHSTTVSVTVSEQISVCDRTSQVRNSILAQLGFTSDEYTTACQSVTLDALGGIEDLDIRGISSLKLGDFDYLNGLITLALQGNELTSVPEGIFADLNALSILLISSNQLTSLPELIFEDLSDIEALVLYTQLTTLPANIFAGLTKLSALFLNGNPFNEGLPNVDILFADVPDSVSLQLDLTPVLGELPSELEVGTAGMNATTNTDISRAFVQATNPFSGALPASDYNVMVEHPNIAAATIMNHTLTVTGLTAGQTTITVVGVGTVIGVGNSETKAHPQTVSVSVFEVVGICDRTTAVRTVILNKIGGRVACEDTTRSQLEMITALDLSGNAISTLSSTDFNDLTSLISLDLSDNLLPTLPEGIFAGLSSLTTLDLSGNPFESGLSAGVVSEIEGLDLTEVRLDVTPVQGNLPARLVGLESSVEIRLDNTFVVGTGGSELLPAQSYDITVSNPTIISATLDSNTTLTVAGIGIGSANIEVQANHGTSAVGMFTVTVTTAGVGGIFGTTIDICTRTPEIQTAILNAINSGDIMGVTCDAVTGEQLYRITELDVSNAGVTALSATDFIGLRHLTTVNLSMNALETLPEGIFDQTTRVEVLDLSDNSLIALPENLFINLNSLTNLYLDGNPFNEGLPNLEVLFADVSDDIVIQLDLTPVLGELPSELGVGITDMGATTNTDISHAFIQAANPLDLNVLLPASDYNVIVEDSDVATATVVNHILIITGLTAGQTTITVVGVGNLDTTVHPQTVSVSVFEVVSICDRTTAVRTIILNEIDGSVACEDTTRGQLEMITALDLSGNVISTLSSTDFNDLTGLTSLDLSDNALPTLPEGIFADLSSLTILDLSGNPFESGLSAGVVSEIDGLDLTEVRLDVTPVQGSLPAQLVGLESSVEIRLDNAFVVGTGGDELLPAQSYDITVSNPTIVSATLDSNTTLTVAGIGIGSANIVVQANRGTSAVGTFSITVTTEGVGGTFGTTIDICTRTPEVQTAILNAINSDGIMGVTCDAVTGEQLYRITELDVSNVGATTLSATDFIGLSHLTTVNLSMNALETLPEGIFDETTRVEVLDLSDNGLTALSKNLFVNLNSLTKLFLEGNIIMRLSGDFFMIFERLTELTLDLTAIGDVPQQILNTQSLEIDVTEYFVYVNSGGVPRYGAASYSAAVTMGTEVVAASVPDSGAGVIRISREATAVTGFATIEVTAEQDGVSARQEIKIEVADPVILFRIKVFLEGAQ